MRFALSVDALLSLSIDLRCVMGAVLGIVVYLPRARVLEPLALGQS